MAKNFRLKAHSMYIHILILYELHYIEKAKSIVFSTKVSSVSIIILITHQPITPEIKWVHVHSGTRRAFIWDTKINMLFKIHGSCDSCTGTAKKPEQIHE